MRQAVSAAWAGVQAHRAKPVHKVRERIGQPSYPNFATSMSRSLRMAL
jgi:hypothetical protein